MLTVHGEVSWEKYETVGDFARRQAWALILEPIPALADLTDCPRRVPWEIIPDCSRRQCVCVCVCVCVRACVRACVLTRELVCRRGLL